MNCIFDALGFNVEYLHRTNRQGFKAGALAEGLKTATGEFVAIFDADFIPPTDFLLKTVHHFTDPKVGVVQTRWSYLNREYNFLTELVSRNIKQLKLAITGRGV